MPPFALYLFKLSVSLSAAWLFYQLFLRRLTFYAWNRWYLLGYSILSFFIPFINVEGVVREGPGAEGTIVSYIPAIGHYQPAGVGPWDLVYRGLAIGSLLLLVRLAGRWMSLRRIRRKSRLLSDDGALQIYQVDEPVIPFSFGKAIYINASLHKDEEWSAIILHEYVHIRQRHTLDIMLAEVFCVLNWYNPFAWLIRHAIRQNLEFIADGKVLEKGLDKKGYQYHLLKVVGEPRYRLANNFNFSSLKKRIIMMNKIRSARLQLVKFLFLLPFFAVLLVAFRGQSESKAIQQTPQAGAVVLAAPSSIVTSGRPDERVKTVPSRPRIVAVHITAPVAATRVTDTVPDVVNKDKEPMDSSSRVIIRQLDKSSLAHKEPMYIVDDKVAEGGIKGLKPNDIARIEVLKDQTAVAIYGEKGRQGVVLVYTKEYENGHPGSGANNGSSPSVRVVNHSSPSDSLVIYSSAGKDDTIAQKNTQNNVFLGGDEFKGILFLDGHEISKNALKTLNPNMIKSMEVLKGEGAIKKYGDKGKDGVILITTKK